MNLRSRIVLLAFVLWTVFVWGNRISNTLRSEESASSKTFSTVLSVILLAFAVLLFLAIVVPAIVLAIAEVFGAALVLVMQSSGEDATADD